MVVGQHEVEKEEEELSQTATGLHEGQHTTVTLINTDKYYNIYALVL